MSASEPRTVAEITEHFKNYYVGVRALIEESGARWSVSSFGDGELVAPPVGGVATVIVHMKTGRCGLIVNEGGWELRGLGKLTYRVDDQSDAWANAAFLAELELRLRAVT
ncbi:MAG: hypothetical protein WA733_09060 [Methylocystis sp.]